MNACPCMRTCMCACLRADCPPPAHSRMHCTALPARCLCALQVNWNKGTALEHLLDMLGLKGAQVRLQQQGCVRGRKKSGLGCPAGHRPIVCGVEWRICGVQTTPMGGGAWPRGSTLRTWAQTLICRQRPLSPARCRRSARVVCRRRRWVARRAAASLGGVRVCDVLRLLVLRWAGNRACTHVPECMHVNSSVRMCTPAVHVHM